MKAIKLEQMILALKKEATSPSHLAKIIGADKRVVDAMLDVTDRLKLTKRESIVLGGKNYTRVSITEWFKDELWEDGD